MTINEIAQLPKDEQFRAYIDRYQELHQFLDGSETEQREEYEICQIILPVLLDNFCADDKDYLCLDHNVGAMAEGVDCIACFEKNRYCQIAHEALNVAGGLTNYVEPRPELTKAERAIEQLQKRIGRD